MKNKLSLILSSLLIMGFVACTKNNINTITTVVYNNPNITLNDQAYYLTGTSRAFYTSSLNNNSIIIVNTSTADTSYITKLLNLNSVSSSVNYLELEIESNNTISQTSYIRGTGNTVGLGAGFQVGGQAYSSKLPAACTISVDTLNTTFISGSYTASAINTTNGLDGNTYMFSGRFRAYF